MENLKEFLKQKYYEREVSESFKQKKNQLNSHRENFTKNINIKKQKEFYELCSLEGELMSLEIDEMIEFIYNYVLYVVNYFGA